MKILREAFPTFNGFELKPKKLVLKDEALQYRLCWIDGPASAAIDSLLFPMLIRNTMVIDGEEFQYGCRLELVRKYSPAYHEKLRKKYGEVVGGPYSFKFINWEDFTEFRRNAGYPLPKTSPISMAFILSNPDTLCDYEGGIDLIELPD